MPDGQHQTALGQCRYVDHKKNIFGTSTSTSTTVSCSRKVLLLAYVGLVLWHLHQPDPAAALRCVPLGDPHREHRQGASAACSFSLGCVVARPWWRFAQKIGSLLAQMWVSVSVPKSSSSTVGGRYTDGGVKLHSAPAGGTRRRFWASES